MASIKGLWYAEAREGQGHKQRGGGGEATGGDTGSETSAHPGEPRPVETPLSSATVGRARQMELGVEDLEPLLDPPQARTPPRGSSQNLRNRFTGHLWGFT